MSSENDKALVTNGLYFRTRLKYPYLYLDGNITYTYYK